jgi:hypothetical protein
MYVESGDTQVVRLVHSKKNVSLRFKANGKGRSLIIVCGFMHRVTQILETSSLYIQEVPACP